MLEELSRRDVEYALKVPMHPWLGLKDVVQRCRRWRRVDTEISYFATTIPVPCWEMDLPVVVYRRRVNHETRKNFQLDLFHPDDGHYEYSVVTSNKRIGASRYGTSWPAGEPKRRRWQNSRTAPPSTPCRPITTRPTAPGSSCSVLAMNLLRRFEVDTNAPVRSGTRKRIFLYVLESIKTARFKWLNIAGRIVTTNGTHTLRLSDVTAVRRRYEALEQSLALAA
jgi:hypothetical protein